MRAAGAEALAGDRRVPAVCPPTRDPRAAMKVAKPAAQQTGTGESA